jgi:hypothetical protein
MIVGEMHVQQLMYTVAIEEPTASSGSSSSTKAFICSTNGHITKATRNGYNNSNTKEKKQHYSNK